MDNMNDDIINGLILICSPTKRSIRKIAKVIGNDDYDWAYLGEDVTNALAVEEWVGARVKHIDISEKLQETANSLRQPYIDYIGKLSVQHNSMLWWAGSLSEKNHFISKTFLYSCYIKVALSLLESHRQDNLILFVENRSLRLSLIDNISDISGYDVLHIDQKYSHVLESSTDRVEFIIKHGWFVINNIYRILLTQYIYRLNKIDFISEKDDSKDDLTLIHTWVDGRSFTENNDFQDAYFGRLNKYMAKNGKNVVIVPYILHTVSYAKTIKKLINCKEHFIIPSAHLSIANVLSALIKTLKKPEKKSCSQFENIDISDIIHLNQVNDWKDTRLTSNLLVYDVVRNLKNQKLSIDRFIYPHENHTWEKMYCIAFREYFPDTNFLGYQHSTISKMYLMYSISQYEREIVPFPDVIITNGKYFKDILIYSGYESEKLVIGGAIRYEYITDMIKQPIQLKKHDDSEKRVKILVAASIDKNESCELLQKVLGAFGNYDIYDIILKFHPLMPYQRIANEMHITALPEHFIVSTESINTLLNECDILLYKTTTTCVEALATGVYPIHIKSSYIIDCDILDSVPEGIHTSVKTDDELLSSVREFSEMNLYELHKRKIKGKSIAHDFFGTVNDSVYELFLKVK